MELEQYTVNVVRGDIALRFKKDDGGYHRQVIAPADDDKAAEYGLSDVVNLIWTDELRERVAAENTAQLELEEAERIAYEAAKEEAELTRKKEFEDAVAAAVLKLL